jgi:prepilin-type N-terminal cleavage/methylation domain-containing protein
MSKLKKDSNGFSAVELIMALVIIALIGAVGWLVYKNHHNDTSTTTSSAIPAIPVKPNESVASPYAGWNTYTLPKEKLTFRYPTTWTVADTSYTDSNNDGIELTSKTDRRSSR